MNDPRYAYIGRHRHDDTVRLTLRPLAPPAPPTAELPALRLLPPVAADTRDRLRLTRRGRLVRNALVALIVLAACLTVALATRGTVVTWDGLLTVPAAVAR